MRLVPGAVVCGWVLLFAGRDGRWQSVGDFPGSMTCNAVRAERVAAEAREQIGTALASLPADNPMRQQAYGRAEQRVRDRYRCEWQGS